MSKRKKETAFDKLMRDLLAVCPNGSMGEDNYGQLVWYTDLQEGKDGTVEPFVEEDEEDEE